MTERAPDTPGTGTPDQRASSRHQRRASCANDDAMPCDRCGAAMFRMHAVWRCPECGYKTDCCGW